MTYGHPPPPPRGRGGPEGVAALPLRGEDRPPPLRGGESPPSTSDTPGSSGLELALGRTLAEARATDGSTMVEEKRLELLIQACKACVLPLILFPLACVVGPP